VQIELTLEKPVSLEPGVYMVKAEGRKLVVEKIESEIEAGDKVPSIVLADSSDKQIAEVFQKFEQEETNIPMRKFSENVAGYKGGLFKTAKEVDDFIRKERDSWDS
jgi:hypothetical protein